MAATTEAVLLRTRSAFSFLEGASLPEALVDAAVRQGHRFLGLADRDGVFGQPRFWRAAEAAGLIPLTGADLTWSWQDAQGETRMARGTWLVRDSSGWHALCGALTLAWGARPKEETLLGGAWLPEADWPTTGGLVLLPPGTPEALVLRMRERWGPEALRLELMRPGLRRDERDIRETLAQGQRLGIRTVVGADVRHAHPDEAPLLDVLEAIRLGRTLEALAPAARGHQGLITPAELAHRFRDLPEAVRETWHVAKACAFRPGNLGYRFPDIDLPEGVTPEAALRDLVRAGLPLRYPDGSPKAVVRQLRHEVALIAQLGLCGYFLIVADIVRFCREQGIMVQGRGSAANSAVCYVLGITAVDPVARGLLFERFLSADREEWPDIDLDLPSGPLREAVIQYVYRRHGREHAAMTANVITYRPPSALRDVGRVLGFEADQMERTSRKLFRRGGLRHGEPLDMPPADQLQDLGFDPEDPRLPWLFRLARQLLRLPRHLGQHSGGMVLSAGRLDAIVPVLPASMPGRTVIAWDKDDCAELGLLKIDLLGLGMLGVLQDAVPMIRAHQGVTVDYARLPEDDPGIWDMLGRGDTVGVFQLESRAQMAILPRLRPRCFYDLVVSIGLIRPGPIVGRMVQPYLERRAGRAPVTLAHPDLEPVLGRTLGIPIFQEQVMRMAMVMAGFTGAQAERLRRAMGFKEGEGRMRAMADQLRKGMTARGIAPETIEEVVGQITAFAQYGFPEAHSQSFALIAWATAWLRQHHPEAFLACLLNHWPMGFYHPYTLVTDAQRHKVTVRSISINHSNYLCTLEESHQNDKPAVRLGLRYILGLTTEEGRRIERARAIHPFRSLGDMLARTGLSARTAERLAEAGALDGLEGSGTGRRQALWQLHGLPPALRTALLAQAWPDMDDDAPLPDMDPLEHLARDLAVTGLSVTDHPMRHVRERLSRQGVVTAAVAATFRHGRPVSTAGCLIVRHQPPTAKGAVFLTLEDETGHSNIVLAPERAKAHRAMLLEHRILQVTGRMQRRDGAWSIQAEDVRPVMLHTDPGARPATG
ncbi:MAG: error-prone DNA polymerase [Candidatus Sericytochromatia bacterium]|nr:error-prone DNA polymerase [Candidatus Tanganyikabacteria bacterium]